MSHLSKPNFPERSTEYQRLQDEQLRGEFGEEKRHSVLDLEMEAPLLRDPSSHTEIDEKVYFARALLIRCSL